MKYLLSRTLDVRRKTSVIRNLTLNCFRILQEPWVSEANRGTKFQNAFKILGLVL